MILYTLLTGTLPFDDDDESVMREKVIRGVYDDPEWLSEGAYPGFEFHPVHWDLDWVGDGWATVL